MRLKYGGECVVCGSMSCVLSGSTEERGLLHHCLAFNEHSEQVAEENSAPLTLNTGRHLSEQLGNG